MDDILSALKRCIAAMQAGKDDPDYLPALNNAAAVARAYEQRDIMAMPARMERMKDTLDPAEIQTC